MPAPDPDLTPLPDWISVERGAAADIWRGRIYDLLHVEKKATAKEVAASGSTWVEFAGPCPRCDHHYELGFIPDTITSADLGPESEEAYADHDLFCDCEGEHPGRPAGTERGCGAMFAAMIEIERR